uniref:Uncharacterized protein n=1 Tax=uncultured Thiotrichaceae bacterium TaxID=298394 RepID=A0A6S6TDD8_9GAMM|nr:MAG: Unknown protein [uncultured Thiotrichaceae bacterium]
MQSRLFAVIPLIFCLVLPISGWAADQFNVIKVESWDTLNMRAGPGVKNSVIAKLPHNAKNLAMTGGKQSVGRANWVEVKWQGKTGWVSKSYLGAQTAVATQSSAAAPEASPVQQAETMSAPEPKNIIKKKQSGMWILECGNASPYWKVNVLPEWMSGVLGKHKTGMAITHKRQEHGKHHKVALETEIRGANRWNRLRMTMNYTRSCYSRLTKKKEAFSVKGMFNNTEISGCCRALQVP